MSSCPRHLDGLAGGATGGRKFFRAPSTLRENSFLLAVCAPALKTMPKRVMMIITVIIPC